jgi:flagellar biosynthesis/type III secretory pathway protein FliH
MQIPLGAFDVAVVRALYSESTCVSSFAPAIRAKIKQNEEAKALEQARIQAEIEAKALAERLERERQELYWIAKGKEIAEREAKERAIQKALEEARAKAALPKKKTITCVKGNLTKKVIAVNPKCPSGYKKK